jgi:uncharacterized protein
MPRAELEACQALVSEIGIRHEIVRRTDLKDDRFTHNPTNRCYYCRSGIAETLIRVAEANDIQVIADGANSSDLNDYRPGLKAFEEAGVWHPFIDYGYDKDAVRDLAGRLNLSIKHKPSMACLASRIPYHEVITEEKLRRVESAEDFLRDLTFTQVRVRHLKDNVARIEVISSELNRILEPEVRSSVISKLKELGFTYVTIDLEGFRSGSMNLNLTDEEKKY